MAVPILKQGDYLIATIQTALSDTGVLELRDDLADSVGRLRSRGIIIDVAALDGIQPDVAVAMVQFQLDLAPLETALDLEEALALLDRRTRTGHVNGR